MLTSSLPITFIQKGINLIYLKLFKGFLLVIKHILNVGTFTSVFKI